MDENDNGKFGHQLTLKTTYKHGKTQVRRDASPNVREQEEQQSGDVSESLKRSIPPQGGAAISWPEKTDSNGKDKRRKK